MIERDTYPERFGIQDIRQRYFEMRNRMVRAWHVLCKIRHVCDPDLPAETWIELEQLLAFDANDRIFMGAVFAKQEAEQEALKQLRVILRNAPATMEGLARIEVLLEETDKEIKHRVPDWIAARLEG
jgi:hypothetical protein